LTSCERIKIRRRQICVGDLREVILIQRRTIERGSINTPDYDEKFEDVARVRAAVQTNIGYKSFNEVGINEATALIRGFTHKFYIRFVADCIPTTENFIEWCDEKYKILAVENLDARSRFLAISSIQNGPKDRAANLA